MDDVYTSLERLERDADRLAAWMAATDGFAHARLAEVRAALDARLYAPLSARFDALAKAHRALLDTLPTGADQALPLRPELWATLTRYRADVEAQVLGPLHDLLDRKGRDGSDPVAHLVDATLVPFAALSSFSNDAPRRLTRLEPAGLLDPTADDATGIRFRKALARGRRSLGRRQHAVRGAVLGLVGKAPRASAPPTQVVFAQALLDYHAQVRLGSLFEALHESAQQALAAVLADVTEALDGWLHTVLRAEAALDRAALHDLDLDWPDEVVARSAEAAAGLLATDRSGTNDTATPPDTEGDGSGTALRADPLTEDEGALVRAVLNAALVLQRALDDARALTPTALFAEAASALDAAHAVLFDDLDRSSKHRLRPTRMLPPLDQRPASRVARRAEVWAGWHPTLRDRLGLMRQLLGLRSLLLAELGALVGRVGQSGLRPVLSAVESVVDDLLKLSAAADRACQAAASDDDIAGLTTALRGLLKEAVRKTEGQLLRRLQTSSLSAALERGLAAADDRIAAAVAALPESLDVATELDERPLDPRRKPERALIRPMAQTVLDQSFLARLGEGGDALKQPLFRVLAMAEEVQSAVHYNLDAALEELGAALPETAIAPEVVPNGDAAEADADLLALDDGPATNDGDPADSGGDAPPPSAEAATPALPSVSATQTRPPAEPTAPAESSGSNVPQVSDSEAKHAEVTDTQGKDAQATNLEVADPGVTDAERIASARELTVTGLARSAERLGGIVEPLHAPWEAFLAQAAQVFERRWGMLHQRIEAAGVEGQFMDMRLRVADEGARMGREAQNRLRTLGARAGRTAKAYWRRVRSLIRRGQSAAGLTQSADTKQATLDALREISTLRQQLPLVYRRLFSFEPIADPLLLQGREAPLQTLATVVERWRTQQPTSALVVSAPMGGGATSFLRVASATLLTGHTVHRVDLTERLSDPDALAEALARAFELDLPAPEQGVSRLAQLERGLLAGPDTPERVCHLDHLEHLMLRTSGGLAPLETVLTFFSRTDHRVLWLTTMNESGWRFVAKTAPALTGLVTPLPLPSLERDAIETVILKRHARSGLPLTFEEPQAPAPLLVRRLKAAKTEAARQDLLRTDYFDRLARTSGRSIALALFYWLRSLDFEATADRLTVRSLPPLDFSFLTGYDLPRAFALKALLQHGTLSLSEYQLVFRTTPREGYLLFESLANELLISRANGTTKAPPPGAPLAVRAGDRYRIHPLLVHPVTEALRSRNML